MTMRIIIGGILGGVAMFMWGALSHIVLQWEESTIKDFPNEEAVIPVLQTNITSSGFYFFPGMGVPPTAPKEKKDAAMKKWMEKYQAGPRGIFIYRTDGGQAMSPKQLGLQLASEVVAALVAATVLACATSLRSFGGRLTLVTLLGLLPFCMVNFPYWNWYGFPDNYTLVQLADKIATFFIGGIFLAAIVKPRAPAGPPEKVQLS
jgi:hypothetical protein